VTSKPTARTTGLGGRSFRSSEAICQTITESTAVWRRHKQSAFVRDARIEFVELFRGTIDGAPVYPREVVRVALAKIAAAVLIGYDRPSHADELTTRRLQDALAFADIRLRDHIIIAGGEAVSFAERGLP
jgi:DNA repair protein RadC